MGTFNVNRNVTDAFYRYKMPRLMAKVEGKGNGIKTVLVNMVDVAKALGRPPTYPTKYFGCELGAQTQFDFRNERFIVNGSHDAPKLQDLLDGFIRKFVLCPECDNPETTLHVQQKKGTVLQVCKACGSSGSLDGKHKLITFVLKNPPEQKPAAQGSSLTEGKRNKRSKKQNGEVNGDNHTNTSRNSISDGEMAAGDKEDGEPAKGEQEEDDLEDWSVDVSEEAVRARMQDLGLGARNLAIADSIERSEKERADQLYEQVRSLKAEGRLDSSGKAVLSLAEELGLKAKAPLVLSEILFDQCVAMQAKEHRILLLRFTHECPRAQRYLLGGLEQTIVMHKDALMGKVPHILKAFYDMDIIEEEVLLEWGKKSSKYVSKEMSCEIRAKAEPFLKWLEEAEEEESSEEE